MVLASLGCQITNALKKLSKSTVVDDAAVDECLKSIVHALLSSDVNIAIVKKLRNSIKSTLNSPENSQLGGLCKKRVIQKCVVSELISMLTASREPFVPKKGTSNVIMFVGLQGSGKTTTCTKFGHYYLKKGWKTCLVCADTFRAGAFDQLKQNATKARIPFYGSYTESDPVSIAQEGVQEFIKAGYEIIIVDTSGRHKQENALFAEMIQLAAAIKPACTVFIMDSHIGQACYDQALAFSSSINVGSVIITKVDGHAKGGGALSAVAATDSPIIFIGTGEHFDDFESFDPKSFVSRLLGMGDISGLLRTIKDAVPLDKQTEMMNRLSKGLFSLRDFRQQFLNAMNMGPLSSIVSMIPGFNSSSISKLHEAQGENRLKIYITCMNSMTAQELDGLKPMIDSRILRVAVGSGTPVRIVKELLDQHKQFSKLVGRLGKMGLTKENAMSNLTRNPNQMMSKLSKMIDPKVLQQFGGPQSLMNLMKQMGD